MNSDEEALKGVGEEFKDDEETLKGLNGFKYKCVYDKITEFLFIFFKYNFYYMTSDHILRYIFFYDIFLGIIM